MIERVVLLLYGVLALLVVGLLGLAFRGAPAGRRLVYGSSLALSGAMATIALAQLLDASAAASVAWLPLGLPWQGAHFRLDALSAFFGFVTGAGGAAASLFALGYGRHESEPARVLPFYPLFLAGMNLVVLADDAFAFLLSWELMSLASWALVMAHHKDSDSTRAGFVYLVMASFSTLALLLAFGLLAAAGGDYTFDAMRGSAHAAGTATLVLALTMLGAGSKAGLVPLHAWLPLAHPAAPSHVSALMSGVMTKVAVYGFIRIVFELLGEPHWWTGFLVLLAGGATAVLGVLYALMQHDLKRLLAYHTVENIGIIFIGLGLALAFGANGLPAAAALALTAALFHVFNHSLFKSLLFFGAGAVLAATGERDMERLGGLIHRMPKTAFAFLAGCIAISALPPLNGFVSEWLTFQAILQSPELPQWALKIMVPAVGGMLALSAALAAACFVKAFGIIFLGRPRSDAAREAREADGFSLAAMFALAALCLAAGILPGFVIDALAPAMQALLGERMPLQAGMDWLSIVPIAAGRSSYNGWLVFAFIALSASLAVVVIHRFASHARRRAPAWDCGAPDPDPATQYTAGSFVQPIRRVFGTWIFAARERVEMPPPGSTAPARHAAVIRDLLWDWLYAPVAGLVGFASERLNVLQFLTIRRYLSLVFLALVALLLVLAIWP
jgi:formate hydrogenlyase subunit 3/multisubunit Na+/H+ antiporter MnhD subunit